MNQQAIIDSLPAHLRFFVQIQHPNQYSAREHATWRFVMKQLTKQLAASAHPVYLQGLRRTGIALDHIPSIDEMNLCLAKLGWRAVVVDGFIPPAIFMEFQALKVLVIALDMRSVEHIFYTPAPDILHESAGHAPMIVDVDYAEYLQRFGEIGMRAIATRHDLKIYEAIRQLSILKESPDSSAATVNAAEVELQCLLASDQQPSEAALLTRLHWWTVEYGLVGQPDEYTLYGAGLLSSLAESRHCLDDDRVKKIPLTVDAVLTPYDITREQPQLFVTKSCKHLNQVLEEFAASMCFRKGGAESVRTAIAAESVCTAVYDTGVQISGQFSKVLCDALGKATYIQTTGPTQLAYNDSEIVGHGKDYHAQGFGAPVGYLANFSRCLSTYSVDELTAHGVEAGKSVRLEYLSGITVAGILQQVYRLRQRNLILSFVNCTVTNLDGEVLFAPEWGVYDMVVGTQVQSVYGGVADRNTWQLFKPAPHSQTIRVGHDEVLMALYQQVAQLQLGDQQALQSILQVLPSYPREWLLRWELLSKVPESIKQQLLQELEQLASHYQNLADPIALVLAEHRATPK